MVQILLTDLIRLQGSEAYWPQEFRAMIAAFDEKVKEYTKAKKAPKEAKKTDDDEDDALADKPTLDVGTLHPLNDWLKENDEPLLARAVRFVLRHKLTFTYDDAYSFKYFKSSDLPSGWYLGNDFEAKTSAHLFAAIAQLIRKKMEELEMQLND